MAKGALVTVGNFEGLWRTLDRPNVRLLQVV